MSSDRTSAKPTPNRLIREKSPYLLEHAYNPVDWYPWGEEAFNRAAQEDKPIFLSVGYSSCHWCHVFRRESLEDPAVAEILNDNFVSIKVDREERPDVDEIYMKAVMSMTGSGGWPLNVFLTPALEPFYGGTYFPPSSRGGLPGFALILKMIAKSWKTEREKIVGSANGIRRSLVELYKLEAPNSPTGQEVLDDESLLDRCFNELASTFDPAFGGFGSAPKFPSSSNLFFLLRYYKKTGAKAPLLMVRKTLDKLAEGGIHDHVGGGFHRYSTDREWLVPHFEKMLYDNALLASVYTEAYLATGAKSYESIVKETLRWVLREMTQENGGFFSAQDADTPEGEGAYYLWDPNSLLSALSEDSWGGSDRGREMAREAEIVEKYFGITKEGNLSESTKSVLTSSEERLQSLAKDYSLPEQDILYIVDVAKERMREFRKKRRMNPSLDDKVLTSWNGLMISAMAKAYQAFGSDEFLSAAKRSVDFIFKNLVEEPTKDVGTRLVHRFRDGDASGDSTLEDYAYLLNGLIDLYEADFDPDFLAKAKEIADSAIEQFYDRAEGAFFLTAEHTKYMIARPKEAFDGAIPSPNSAIALALFRLAELLQKDEYLQKAIGTLRAFSRKIDRQPSAYVFMLVALYFHNSPPREVVISGTRDSPGFSSMVGALRTVYLPDSVLLLADESLRGFSPLSEGRIAKEGEATRVFVCRANVCDLPSSSVGELLDRLKH